MRQKARTVVASQPAGGEKHEAGGNHVAEPGQVDREALCRSSEQFGDPLQDTLEENLANDLDEQLKQVTHASHYGSPDALLQSSSAPGMPRAREQTAIFRNPLVAEPGIPRELTQ